MKTHIKHIMKKTNIFRAALVAVIAFAGVANAYAADFHKNIGIQLYSVMDAMNKDPKGTVEKLAEMGYKNFELVQWGGEPKVFGMDAKDFRGWANRNGVKILSTHSGIQEDPANEEEIMNKWRQLFEIQKTCGGKYFVIPSYQAEYTTAGIKQMADYFNKVGKLAKEYGLTLGYHNHSHEFTKLKDSDQLMWEYLVENTDPDLVCFELDVYWATKGNQSPVALLQKYPKRIKLLHIKDDFVIGASGTIDFENIFKQFYKNGMKDFVVEIETPQSLREKKNEDGSNYTAEQINNELLAAARFSVEYLNNAKFVK